MTRPRPPRQLAAIIATRSTEGNKPVRCASPARAAGKTPPAVAVPVGFTTFPGEIFAAPRSWVETVYPGLAYFNEVDRGGHFAAWEEPKLFSEEVRAAFRSLRK